MFRAELSLCLILCAGCVSAGTQDAKVAELERVRRESIDREKALLGRIGALEKQVEDQARRLQGNEEARARLAKQLDGSIALVGELRERLRRLGQDVDQVDDEGTLGESLRETEERLDELRRQRAAAEASARTYRGLQERLQGMIDAGQLQVVVRDGRMLITLPDDVLFDSGRTQVKPAGQAALAEVARALKAIPDRRFLVAGHTDDLPIRTSRFPSNWELSAARAVEVTRLLVEHGVRPQALSAAGYGEFSPLHPNDSPEHRAQNRRIEIVVQPNVTELSPEALVGAP